ncbi:MAG TPA: SIR2 family protein [Pyrinomonadaceae bacterium]|nr:SIR2 family protein [Pyrinomonadaceae bacterium]
MSRLSQNIPASLLAALRNHKCIPFVGSGLSLPFGLPTWGEAIDRLVERCRAEKRQNYELITYLAKEGEYLEAAQRAEEKLGRDIYREELERAFGTYDTGKEKRIQRLLWELNPPLIITTNFDTLLEDSTEPRPLVVTPQHKSKLYEIFRNKGGKVLFKVHGSIDEFESVVFTREDYETLYTNDFDAYRLSFMTPILENTLLFMGFGLRDEAILRLLQSIARMFDNFSGTHYAFVKRGEASVAGVWEAYKVNVVEYDGHEEIEEALNDFKGRASAGRHDAAQPPGRPAAPPAGAGDRISLAPSERIPKELALVRQRCIEECIFIELSPCDEKLKGWNEHDIFVEKKLSFFKPKGRLKEIQKDMGARFERMHYIPTPRYCLSEVYTEGLNNYRHGGITVTTQLTDWSLVHGIQRILEERQSPFYIEVEDLFWRSVNSIAGNRQSLNFPHHLAVHCLVISGDNKVILSKRVSVSNQRGRVSASFEEQMQFPYIFPSTEHRAARFFDGDETPFDSIVRGAREEFNIELDRKDIKITSLCMEASSIAANFLAVAKSPLPAKDIYACWQRADDKGENLMIPPGLSPEWEVGALLPLLGSDVIFDDDPLYRSNWHASSKARIVLGLMHDFGIDLVSKHIATNLI